MFEDLRGSERRVEMNAVLNGFEGSRLQTVGYMLVEKRNQALKEKADESYSLKDELEAFLKEKLAREAELKKVDVPEPPLVETSEPIPLIKSVRPEDAEIPSLKGDLQNLRSLLRMAYLG
eukprot:TRINITY_DN11879_c0_g1_i1.p1 TRINITY_DN11879_c0_g1~~TRINITY_DN11879_c0_g1_i1.p1  ORF type:complete len:120 (+),score=19.55 TRINITY_DN11879_c0_g1_i1:120-479(+)